MKTMHSASEHGNNGKCCASVRYPMKQHAKSKKDFEAAQLGVFAIELRESGLNNPR